MPTITIAQGTDIYYEDDCFADPWRKPETVLLIHGLAESSRAWIGWVPWLSREFRVIRPDMRGAGKSSIPQEGFKWSNEVFVDDLKKFIDKLQIPAVHIIGAKMGGSIAFEFAAKYPENTLTLAVASGPVRVRNTGGSFNVLAVPNRIRAIGLKAWAAETQRSRLGTEASQEQVDWWTSMMAESDTGACIGIASSLDQLSVLDQLSKIRAATLIITTDRSPLQSVETVREAHKEIANSEMVVISSDSYHIAAVQPDTCARYWLDFVKKQERNKKI